MSDAAPLLSHESPNTSGQICFSPDEMDLIRTEWRRMALKLDVAQKLVVHHRAQVEEYQAELARVTEQLATVETAYQAVVDATRGGG